jgi:hypothetical protein
MILKLFDWQSRSTTHMPAKASENRFYQRLPTKCRIAIYPYAAGRGSSILARGIDMSRAGILIQTNEPLRVGSMVYVRIDELGLMGTAAVRHCKPSGSKFKVGLHFTTPLSRSL